VPFDEVRELVDVLDSDDLDMLLDVVRAAYRNVAAAFCQPGLAHPSRRSRGILDAGTYAESLYRFSCHDALPTSLSTKRKKKHAE